MLIVPTTADGFSWTPVHTMAGVDTSATYYQDVRVPATSLVGEENGGWKLVTNQLNHERVALVSAQPIFLALNGVREWAQNTKDAHGNRLIDSEWVQLNLARVHAKAEVLKLINWELASTEDAAPSPADASAAKVFGTELATEAYRLLMEVLGTAATLRTGLARRAAARPDRAHAPVVPDPDLRRRHQRDPARHHRHGRARPAPSEPVRTDSTWISRLPKPPTTSAAWCAPSPNRCARPSTSVTSTGWTTASTTTCGPSSCDADILSTAAPESLGGGGFGVLEQVAVLVALGRQMAAVPYLESAVLAAGALAKFGSEALQQAWAVPAVNGEKILAVALDGDMGEGPVQATASGDGYRLTGTRTQVAYGPSPTRSWCPPKPIRAPGFSWWPRTTAGVSVSSLDTTGHGSVGHLELPRASSSGPTGWSAREDVVSWLTTHATLGRSAFQLGVLERALELTAEYAREREQFDRPIGSFQAVSSRLADGYIDIKGLRLTVTQAAWRLSEDLPAEVDVNTAAFWAADAGHRVAHTTVHVHGGVGIDTDHPVHRYFLAAKQTEFAVGGATGQLLRIGRELADTPA